MKEITDLTPYRQHVDVFDITDEQKLELINIMQLVAENILDKQFNLNQPDIASFKIDESIEIEGVNGNVESE